MAGLIPTALATAAVGAYLNAKLKLPSDWILLRAISGSQRDLGKRWEKGQGNSFYALEQHANDPKIANEIFLIYEGKSWTFKEFYNLVLSYAGWLHNTHKVVPGEIVALDFMNSPALLCLVVAIWSLGAFPALINYNLTSKSLIHSVKISTARLLIVESEVAKNVLTPETKDTFLASNFRNNTFPLEISILDTALESSLKYFPPYRAPDTVRVQEKLSGIAALLYTSGTTGLPKAAIVPWSKTAIGAYITARVLGIRPVNHRNPDRYYTCMPIYHMTAFTLSFHTCLLSASTLVLSRKFSLSRFWPEVRSSESTIILYVGETLRYLLAASPSPDDRNNKVRLAHGNGLRPDVWKRFRDRFDIETIIEIYGSTEGPTASWNINRNDFTDGAVGSYGLITTYMADKNQKFVKVDWNTESPWRDFQTGFCEVVPKGEKGELLVEVDPADMEAKFVGYFNNKDASSSKILFDVLKKGDAYFRTGDIMRRDKDGRLWFEDRIGDTYRWKSENVSTTEVGDAIGLHDQVNEANVYGVHVPGHEGRAGCVALLLADRAMEQDVPRSEVLESLGQHVIASLPKYAIPIFLRLTKQQRLTGNNKQQKTELRNEGIDLKMIESSASTDRLFWLKPGTSSYVEFGQEDYDALKAGKIRL